MSPLPSGWVMLPINDVGRWFGGGTPSKSTPKYWTNNGIPWVSPKDMKFDVIKDAQDHITEDAVINSATNLVETGSVLVVARSGILQHTLPVAVTERKVALNQDIKAVQPLDNIRADYLALALKAFEREILHTCTKTGTTVQSLEMPVFLRFKIPVAPPDEQRRIVAEIEKQFTRLGAGVATLQRVQRKLKRYRAAVLKAACEGRLVPTEAELAHTQNRDYESAKGLLERILQERRAKWNGRGKYSEPVTPSTQDLPKLPEGWGWASAEEVCSTVASGSTPKADFLFSGSGEVPFIKVYNLTFGGIVNFSVKPTYVETHTHNGQLSRSRVFPGDVLTNIVGPPLGKVSIVPDTFPEWNINQAIVVFRTTEAISNKLLGYWLLSYPILSRLTKTAKATAGQFNVQVTTCRRLALPLPPLAEQERIVTEVERRLSVVDELEATVTANLQRAARLRQAILQKAFAGELVAAERPPLRLVDAQPIKAKRPSRHFMRAVLSGEIVHQLHKEPTFGRVKHQKILHMCEYIAQLEEIEGNYSRKVAGPFDNKLIFANVGELQKQKWYAEGKKCDRSIYTPLVKAGAHRPYFERYWPDKVAEIESLINLMRTWDTETCEIFSTTYAAWNDLIIWGKDVTEEAILHEILHRWDESKTRIHEKKWRKAISWMTRKGYVPTGFGRATAEPE